MKLCKICKRSFRDSTNSCPFDGNLLEFINDPLIGALINEKYVLEDLIGEGASSTVYKATRLLIGQDVAVKILNYPVQATAPSLAKFFREITATSRIRHQNIVTVFESGLTDDNKPFMVMEYLEGNTLSRTLAENDTMSISRVIDIVGQVARGLNEAHQAGIIHKDIKPANILLSSSNSNNDFVKIVDFGIAELNDVSLIRSGTQKIVGSPAYMSPEQCKGTEVDFKTDIYATGILTFELLTGKRPFSANDIIKLMQMHISDPIPNIYDFDAKFKNYPELNNVIKQSLAKSKTDRQNSILEFFEQLEASIKMPSPNYSKLNSPKAERERKVNINNDDDPSEPDLYSADFYDIPIEERLIELADPVKTLEFNPLNNNNEGIEVSKIMREIIVQAKHNKDDQKANLAKLDINRTIASTPNENVIHDLGSKLELKHLNQSVQTTDQLKQWHANKISSESHLSDMKKAFQQEKKAKPILTNIIFVILAIMVFLILKFVLHSF